MSLALGNIPIFTASGKISVKIMSNCDLRKSGLVSTIFSTLVVFWAVRAVMALMAYTPFMVIVFKSA